MEGKTLLAQVVEHEQPWAQVEEVCRCNKCTGKEVGLCIDLYSDDLLPFQVPTALWHPHTADGSIGPTVYSI